MLPSPFRPTPEERQRFTDLDKVFIVSGGRTGTTFLGVQLARALPGAFSVHEPDRLSPDDLPDVFRKLRQQGPVQLLAGKLLGVSGTRNLSLHRLDGTLDGATAIDRLIAERRWALPLAERVYIEANYQLFGLIPDLVGLPRTRVAVLLRNPRSWVESWLGKRWFSKSDLMANVNVLGFKRLSPRTLGEPMDDWKSWGRLEKLCWTWANMNQRFADCAEATPEHVRLFLFEDIFERRDPEALRELLEFTAPGIDLDAIVARTTQLLEERINASRAKSHPFAEWPDEEQDVLLQMCGPLARRLGYAL